MKFTGASIRMAVALTACLPGALAAARPARTLAVRANATVSGAAVAAASSSAAALVEPSGVAVSGSGLGSGIDLGSSSSLGYGSSAEEQLLEEIEELMLGLGINSFPFEELVGLGVSDEQELLLQLEEMEQLEQLGELDVSCAALFIEEELAANEFDLSLSVIKRTISASLSSC
ncbi:hypothetical protein GGR56DRAFT_177786 [Xylariaceae sp. FL0804]|nr:hypothetical protein GGR56DRAFT_177786 [Xylariaceae sp. FL0804]